MAPEQMTDFAVFHSRLQVSGRLRLTTPMRIGAGSSLGAAERDLPVVKDLSGRPYVPGSSFKGAFRAHLEALIRAIRPELACLSTARPSGLGALPGCLTQEDVAVLKEKYGADLEGLSRAILQGDQVSPEDVPSLSALLKLDGACWTCRLCGAPWIASKLMVRDMDVVDDTWFNRYLERDGVAIDRDTGTAGAHLKFDYEAVPAGTAFHFEMVIDNATAAELGIALLGLREFEDGLVTLGGGRSRGLGQVALDLEWDRATWVTRENLVSYLLDRNAGNELARRELSSDSGRMAYLNAFLAAIGEGGTTHA